jgi:transcriptional regulator with XRE-family HTH domain
VEDLAHYELAASQVLRALRGGRSQIAWARRLGYRGNPITDWEHGRRFPTAPETLRAASRAKVDLARVFAPFSPAPPPHGRARFRVNLWLDSLRGSTSVVELARRTGCSRFSVARWLSGASTPRLPDFLRLLEATSGRAAEWVANLVPIDRVPSLEASYRRMIAARRISLELPWSGAVLRVLETTAYTQRSSHSDAWIAAMLGIEARAVSDIVRALGDAGAIEQVSGGFRVKDSLVVDTKADLTATERLRRHWARTALARVEAGSDDWFAYNVISVSEQDCKRIEARMRAAFREVRGIVKNSQPCERACLLTMQLVRW